MKTSNPMNTLLRYICLLMGILPTLSNAQTEGDAYPKKNIRMVIGFPAGGPTDTVGRAIAQKMSLRLGQPVIVENIAGAGANIGAHAVARAAPDGYTIHYNTSTLAIAPSIYPKLAYHPVKDFSPVVLTAEVPLVMVVNPSVKVETLVDLIELIKKRPGHFNYGSSGNGTIEHLALANFVDTYKLDASHVAYKGVAPAVMDLMAGQTQFGMTSLNTVLPYILDGRLRALAVTSKQRSKVLPSVPTINESLGPKFIFTAWQGIVVPKRTPRAIVERLNRIVNDVLSDKVFVQTLSAQGVDVIGGSTDQYGDFLRSELDRWSEMAKNSGIRP